MSADFTYPIEGLFAESRWVYVFSIVSGVYLGCQTNGR